MKKSMLLALVALVVTALAALAAGEGKPQIHFNHTKVDVGTIRADGGPVTFKYTFTNTGDAPLVIIKVTNGGCGCTKPTFTREPIRPGGQGEVSVQFDPRGRRGEFSREIRVRSNSAKHSTVKLRFTGVITPAANQSAQ